MNTTLRATAACLAGWLWLARAGPLVPIAHAVEADSVCIPLGVGLRPEAPWNSSASAVRGEALGQTFLAPETLLTALTVWRPPNNIFSTGAHLFITALDTTQTPPRPRTDQILLDGPTLATNDDPSPGQVIEMRFAFDPPFTLPGRGLYAFFLQSTSCGRRLWEWSVIANSGDPYPYGTSWVTGGSYPLCTLRGVADGGDSTDLVFNAEFRRPTSAVHVAVESAHAELCEVRVAWSAADLGALLITLYRHSPDSDWSPLGPLVADGAGRLAYEDRHVAPGGRYGYRLGVNNPCGPEVFFGEAWVDIPSAPQLVLEHARVETCPESCKVDLLWSNAGGPVRAATVRRRTADSDWKSLGAISADSGGWFRFQDSRVSPGVRYAYLLSVDQCGRERFFFPEAWIEVPAAELALAGVRPNPAGDQFTVALALSDVSPARLELLDLAGRRVLIREVGGLGIGSHLVNLPEARTLPPGVYLVRLTQAGRSRTTRAVLIR